MTQGTADGCGEPGIPPAVVAVVTTAGCLLVFWALTLFAGIMPLPRCISDKINPSRRDTGEEARLLQ